MNEKKYIPTRKLNWKSSCDANYLVKLFALQEAMEKFYKTSHLYYKEIDYAGKSWGDKTQLEAQDILMEASKYKSVLEVGCGKANILKTGKIDQRCYTGIDFSPELIEINKKNYHHASFYVIKDGANFPVKTGKYDYVFSHYVLEHCVFPNLFLNECARALCSNGILSILCPDFLGVGGIGSQRVGFSSGTGREKISQGKYWDALVTGFDNKIRIPIYVAYLRAKARQKPQFFINLAPTCFTDSFNPDVDAVYLTFADEIKKYLSNSIIWLPLKDSIVNYSVAQSHIYIKGHKKPNNEA